MSDAGIGTMDRAPMPGMGVFNKKLGMWVFLLSEVMFFTSLIGSYIILRYAHPDHFAEPGAIVAFSGARVIRATVKEELPEGFQKSEYVQKTGFIDLIVQRKDLKEKISLILSILLKENSDISSKLDETSEDFSSFTKAAS